MAKRIWFVLSLALGLACVDLTPPPLVRVVAQDGMAGGADGTGGLAGGSDSGDTGGAGGSGGTGGTGGDNAGGSAGSGGANNTATGGVGVAGSGGKTHDGGSGGGDTGGAGGTVTGGSGGAGLKTNGDDCAAGTECTSGVCADNVCCNSACTGLCESCTEVGSRGTCAPVAAGTDPASECPDDGAATCKRDGYCNGARACELYAMATSCGASSCSNGVENQSSSCDGNGKCGSGMPHPCAPNLCGPTACATSCATPANCTPGAACIGNACVNAMGLQLYWNFDEAFGMQALDLSGWGRNGTYGGNRATPTASMLVPVLQYPDMRSRTFVTMNNTEARFKSIPSVMKPANNVTLTAWFRATAVTTSTSYAEIANLGDGVMIGISQTKVASWKGRPSDYAYAQIVTNTHLDGKWHHLAAAASSQAGLQLYYDGVLVVTNAATEAIVYNQNSDFIVGVDDSTSYNAQFGGNIDEVRVYTRVLSAADITALAAGHR